MREFINKHLITFCIFFYGIFSMTYLLSVFDSPRDILWTLYLFLFAYPIYIMYFISSIIMVEYTWKTKRMLLPLSIILFEIVYFGIGLYKISTI
jgi:ABC-type transport system involved in multi-copper enzyme maturation permease subunit